MWLLIASVLPVTVEHAVAAGSVVADGNKDEPLLQNDGVYYDSLSYKILTTSQATYHI